MGYKVSFILDLITHQLHVIYCWSSASSSFWERVEGGEGGFSLWDDKLCLGVWICYVMHFLFRGLMHQFLHQKQRDTCSVHTHRHTHSQVLARGRDWSACCAGGCRWFPVQIVVDGRSVGLQGWGNETSAESAGGIAGCHESAGVGIIETQGASLRSYRWDHYVLQRSGGEATWAGLEAVPWWWWTRCRRTAAATTVS